MKYFKTKGNRNIFLKQRVIESPSKYVKIAPRLEKTVNAYQSSTQRDGCTVLLLDAIFLGREDKKELLKKVNYVKVLLLEC